MKKRWILVLWLVVLSSVPAWSRTLVASGTFGAVATGHPLATGAALKMLQNGGNAIDAAVAAGFVLGVVDPSNSGLGGDGHALVHWGGVDETWDGSSVRPAAGLGSSPIGLPTAGHLLLKLHQDYGALNLPQVMAPAIRYASRGFKVSPYFGQILQKEVMKFSRPADALGFWKNGRVLMPGDTLLQPALAQTLMAIARDNGEDFRQGKLGRAIAAELRERGTTYAWEDWLNAGPRKKAPVRLTLGNTELVGVPPPASSVAVFSIVERLSRWSPNLATPAWDQEFLRALRAILDAKYRLLPKWAKTPEKFLEVMRSPNPPNRGSGGLVRESAPPEDAPGETLGDNREETTHLVTWDAQGNIVSMTLTLGTHFGADRLSRFGFFFNNQMEHFRAYRVSCPDYPADLGPITAKSPVLVRRDGKPVLAIGGAGANRIVANVARIVGKWLTGRQTLPELVHEPRMYVDQHDRIVREWHPGIAGKPELAGFRQPEKTLFSGNDAFGLISAVVRQGPSLVAVGDFRRDGSAGALRDDPLAARSFTVEGFLWSNRSLKESRIAQPLNHLGSGTAGWQAPNELMRAPVTDGPVSRDRLHFFPGTTSARVKKNVTLQPGHAPDLPASFQAPEKWLSPVTLSPDEADFLRSVPTDLNPEQLVQWLMVDIGHRLPFRREKGRMTARQLLAMGSGDCSGKARLLRNLLLSRNVPCRLVGGVILREGIRQTTHLWNEVYLHGKWVPVCATNHLFGRIPATWLILRYGEEATVEGDGRMFFRVIRQKG